MSILIGYPGVGKSSLAGKDGFIDLDSSNFWNGGRRWNTWYVYYCNMAEALSKQGYKVLVSSHECVVDQLLDNSKEKLYIISPDISLRKEWTKKLEDRWNETQLDKDFKAYMNCQEGFKDEVKYLTNQKCDHIIIKDLDYSLKDLLKDIIL